jgi:hypothetical protein
MANQWLRLWHDMPTDPKWRTIARVSGQRIGDVMAVYLHLLVCASNAAERGRTQSFNCEDVASALDIDTEQVGAIVDAMQGRVLDGDAVAGWEKRQVAREDGAAERAKAWREAKKAASNAGERDRTQAERNQTPDKDKEEIREEEKKEKTKTARKRAAPAVLVSVSDMVADGVAEQHATDWLVARKGKDLAPLTPTIWQQTKVEAEKAGMSVGQAIATAAGEGWGGFKASWLAQQARASPAGKQTALESRNAQTARQLIERMHEAN